MTTSLSGTCLLACLLLLGACGDDDDGERSGDFCSKVAAITRDLACSDPPTDCANQLAQEQEQAKALSCDGQLGALNTCLVAQPSTSFLCGAGTQYGVSQKAGVCHDEFDAYFECRLGSQ